jgi:hypothetical protein
LPDPDENTFRVTISAWVIKDITICGKVRKPNSMKHSPCRLPVSLIISRL